MRTLALLFALLTTPAIAEDNTGACARCPEVAEPHSEVEDLGHFEPKKSFYHGFRVGYAYANGAATPTSAWRSTLRSPHLFVLGYEATQVIEGGGWLDVILVGNVSIAGLNQNLAIPSANAMVGFEIADQFQIGTGINLTIGTPKLAHQIIAVGWTPTAGAFNVPVHFLVIPDVDGNWRIGATVGVNW